MGWLQFGTLVLSVIGLADAGYQVYTHFTGTGLLGCAAIWVMDGGASRMTTVTGLAVTLPPGPRTVSPNL